LSWEPGKVVHICNPSTQEARQENHEFKASLGYLVRLSGKKKKTHFFLMKNWSIANLLICADKNQNSSSLWDVGIGWNGAEGSFPGCWKCCISYWNIPLLVLQLEWVSYHFFFLWYFGLKPGSCLCCESTLPLSYTPYPLFVFCFWDRVSLTFAWAVLKLMILLPLPPK
jgi:hypothetical protein